MQHHSSLATDKCSVNDKINMIFNCVLFIRSIIFLNIFKLDFVSPHEQELIHVIKRHMVAKKSFTQNKIVLQAAEKWPRGNGKRGITSYMLLCVNEIGSHLVTGASAHV